MPSGAMSILPWERGVQYRSWGGGSSEVEGGLGQRADTKNKYEEAGLSRPLKVTGTPCTRVIFHSYTI